MKNKIFLILAFGIFFGFGIWGLGFGLVGCGHPLKQVNLNAPLINSVYPSTGASGIDLSSVVSATFDKSMDASSLNTATFTLTSATGAISGSVTYNANSYTATFGPLSNLSSNTKYTATISDQVKESGGNRLEYPYSWSFTTGTLAPAVGSLDATFNNSGLAAASVSSDGKQIKIDKNGKILVCGSARGFAALWRYLSDGTPDNTFGTSGTVTNDAIISRAIDLDPQGNIIFAAEGYWPNGHGLRLYKYDENGNIVSGFGSTEVFDLVPMSIAVDAAGNIYVAGYYDNLVTFQESARIWKFKPDGSVDGSFGDGTHSGFVQVTKGNQPAAGYKVLIDGNGKIVLFGSAVWRFDQNGNPDNSFGTNGIAANGVLLVYAAALDGAGNIYVAGLGNMGAGIAKYNSSGSLLLEKEAGVNPNYFDILIDPFGNILLAGSNTNQYSGQDMTIWRYDSSLNLDSSFGNNGMVSYGSADDNKFSANSLAVDSLGRILATGKTVSGSGFLSSDRMGIWRYK